MSAPRLVVVGGGILGTMHALEGVRRGYAVEHLERDVAPQGASVRNFGLIWVGGRAGGTELALAGRARERWEQIGADCPRVGFRPSGSLTLARTKEELAVLEEAATRPDAAERGFALLDTAAARAVEPALSDAFLAALHCGRDATVEPRHTLAALRAHAAASGRYRFAAGCEVVDVAPHAVRDASGVWHGGDLVVCCPGASATGTIAAALADAPLRRVRLQMCETRPLGRRLGHALADGDSLRYYPAYAGGARDALPPQEPVAAAWTAQLLCVQRLDGHLTIGDTHHYAEPFAFDVDVAPERHLLGVAASLLAEELPPVERRWAGVYSETTAPGLLYHRQEIAPGVVVVTGPGGRGMTMSPAIAEETFA